MKLPSCCADKASLGAWIVGIAGLFLILVVLAGLVRQRTAPPAIDEARKELRRRNLVEMRAANQAALETYALLDPTKGIVRLPIERAMQLTLELWRDPAAGRSNLLSRLATATAKPPEKPNPYE